MIEFRVGDVFERLAEIPTGSVDLVVTSPPFLALRSYLPNGHPDKAKEIGSERTPADFLTTLLELTAEWRRVLAPHGSLCVELGDTYSRSGGAGGDYAADGLRAGQPTFRQSKGDGWPLAKSLTGIPTLYAWCLAYGRHLLTGEPSPAGEWRVRNLLCWARPNPPVGALGDKFRPATSYVTVACPGPRRWFDLDAVRTPYQESTLKQHRNGDTDNGPGHLREYGTKFEKAVLTNAGAPPLDWHNDCYDGPTGDGLWVMSTQPYAGSHFATFPKELPRRLIEAMCPREVCTACGTPRTRLAETTNAVGKAVQRASHLAGATGQVRDALDVHNKAVPDRAERRTLGWSDCGCGAPWRAGIVLDPFAGSGTTLAAAQGVGRSAIGIDLDARNADLARQRVGMFLDVKEGAA